MHWCGEETMLLMTAIPFLGVFFRRLHTWYHSKVKHLPHGENNG